MKMIARVMNRWRAWAAWLTGVTGALFLYLGMACGQMPCSYEVTHVIQGPWGGPFWGYPPTTATGISPNGRYVVGYYTLGSGNERAWVFDVQTELFTTLSWPATGWSNMRAADVNDNCIIVGRGDDNNAGGHRGWIYNSESQEYTIIEPLGGSSSMVEAVNSSGAVCGNRSNSFPGDPANPHEAFIWEPADGGTFTNLGVMNGPKSEATNISDDGIVVGGTGPGGGGFGNLGFIYAGGKITLVPPVIGEGGSSLAVAANPGQIVAGYGRIWDGSAPRYRAFAYAEDKMIDIPRLENFLQNRVTDVSSSGLVIGFCSEPTGGSVGYRGFMWANGTLIDIASMIEGNKLLSMVAWAISDQQQIVGDATLVATGESVAFVLTPTMYSAPADINHNCRVDIDDLLVMVNHWGTTYPQADINHDQIVNIDDLLILINNWTLEEGDSPMK